MSKILIPIILGVSLHAQVYQRNPATIFRSAGTPGSIPGSRYGDVYVNTTSSTTYTCTNPTSFCNGVSAGNWVQAVATPGGSSGQVQINNAGSFDGVSTTGSGNIVRATSPTLVTPDLGTPSSITLTNATDVSATPTTNQIPRLNGSGELVLPGSSILITGGCTTTPASPASGKFTYFCDSADSNKFKRVDSSGTVTTVEGSTVYLGDPGSNGVIKRTALNTTAVAVPGVDIYAPGTSVADADITESSVTQHQAALSISYSQIPSGDKAGSGTKIVGTSALGTSGNCMQWGAAGATDSGAPCGTGSGGSITGLYSGVLNFGSIADGSCSDLTFSASGATANMPLALSLPSGINAGVVGNAFVSAANTVSVRLCNFSGASVDPASATYYVRNLDTLGYLSASNTIDPSALADGSCATAGTITVTGAVTGDNVAPGWPSTLDAGVVGTMFVSATDTVSVRLCNWSGATVDVASSTFKAGITK